MRVHLLRHGRTAANAGGLLLGRLDPPLDPEGERQASAAAAHLAAVVGSEVRVVSSPLGRCHATASAVAAALGGVDVTVDERWIELDYGDLDGVALSEVPASTWAAWRADVHWRPPGGETLAELGARVRSACDALVADGGDADVVVVTHVSPVKAAVAWALGVGDEVTWRLFVAPASRSTIAVRGGQPALHAFNDVSHLAGLA